MVTQAPLPDEILSAIREACLKLASGGTDGFSLSVRSSAPSEDGHFSFAGQYASYLNVTPEAVADRYREVLASLFTPRALFYSLSRGFDDKDMVMAVGVMRMVQAVSGGVLYTGDPVGQHAGCMTINGAWGLASLVVEGTGKTDQFIVESSIGKIIKQTLADKQGMVVADEKGGVRLVAVPEGKRLQACLTNDQIRSLTEYGLRLEEHFGKPQDIEWSVGPEGGLYLLQSRPLRVPRQEARKSLPRRIPGQNILIDKGVIASRGVGFGPVFRVSNESDLSMFPQGAVLVARTTSTRYVAVMDRVAAIVTDIGGATGHMASIAREYRVPAILDTDIATRTLSDGQLITVDAINCNVYEGRVEELIEYESGRIEPIRETRLLQRLGQFMQVVAPLNLTDPDRDDFRPEACHTLHDITRFAHEKAMTEMFGLSDTDTAEGAATVTLNAGIPIDAHMIDVGGGIREGVEKALPEDILAIPCRAFLKGLTAMKWPEPRTADMGGFFGMMAHAASIPEEQLQQTAIRSFALLSSSYMNFSIRLGYHFSMVEAFAGETLNDNYVKFFFKGGGAARDRRLRRVRLIAELLRKIDFRVTVTDDVINASLMKFRQSSIEARLEALGRMTVFTKQLDMAMYNDDITDWYRDEFVRDHLEPVIGDTL
jgi:pyruvate,water dikinase